MQTIIIISVVCFVAYLSISNIIRHKRKNKTLPNIVYKFMAYVYPIESREALIFKGINAERDIFSIKPLKSDKYITLSAKMRAERQAYDNNVTHAGVGDTFIELKKRGSDGSGEIIAYAYGTVPGVILGWNKSVKHRRAMLNQKYDYIGVGCILDENKYFIDVVILVNEKTVN